MGEVRVLPTEKVQMSESVVSTLEEALSEAKAGRVESVMLIIFRGNGDLRVLTSSMDSVTQKLGVLERLKFDLLEKS